MSVWDDWLEAESNRKLALRQYTDAGTGDQALLIAIKAETEAYEKLCAEDPMGQFKVWITRFND